jgi:hypothetical protein
MLIEAACGMIYIGTHQPIFLKEELYGIGFSFD